MPRESFILSPNFYEKKPREMAKLISFTDVGKSYYCCEFLTSFNAILKNKIVKKNSS